MLNPTFYENALDKTSLDTAKPVAVSNHLVKPPRSLSNHSALIKKNHENHFTNQESGSNEPSHIRLTF
jgi:hypothetical protein